MKHRVADLERKGADLEKKITRSTKEYHETKSNLEAVTNQFF